MSTATWVGGILALTVAGGGLAYALSRGSTSPPPQCPTGDVLPLSDGTCPTGYIPDTTAAGCCAPITTPPGGSTVLTVMPDAPSFTVGEKITFAGSLTDGPGADMSGLVVKCDLVNPGGSSVRGFTARVGKDGSFAGSFASVPNEGTFTIAVHFLGTSLYDASDGSATVDIVTSGSTAGIAYAGVPSYQVYT